MLDSATTPSGSSLLAPTDSFPRRHLGPDELEAARMLEVLGVSSLDELIDAAVPEQIRMRRELALPRGCGEHESLAELKAIAGRNRVMRNYIGQGYSDTITPPVIQRNTLENPGWYTAYTPYQAEIAQGRLEALVNFQTMITDLTGLEISNASLLDEATAAAEAMAMARAFRKSQQSNTILVSSTCHPQTIDVVRTRAEPLGVEVVIASEGELVSGEFKTPEGGAFALLLQYPTTFGEIEDYSAVAEKAHAAGALVIVATDLLALTLLKPPGEWGADIVVGSAQRFGVPLGHGGPHAAFMATKDAYKRSMPGRLVGVSKDSHGSPAYRLSLQTREQHIRRDKATSNICTAQVLLAVMASMYAVYHGPQGLRRIAERVHLMAATLKQGLLGFPNLDLAITAGAFFDTIVVDFINGDQQDADHVDEAARRLGINLGRVGHSFRIALDETTDSRDLRDILRAFNGGEDSVHFDVETIAASLNAEDLAFPANLRRTSDFLTHPVFNTHHTETEMLRYIRRLEAKDLSLTTSMIPLGSCTMKLNATSEMLPVTWPEFGKLHPFCPPDQAEGYRILCDQLEAWLGEITGFAGVLLEPNAGSQGEYAGLLVIRQYHAARGEAHRNVCLIPTSAHGTNPASAVMAGFKVIPVQCLEDGDIDLADLKAKAAQHSANLGALMVTYPSTHGVFEETIREICEIVHEHGGQVYMDGANMNAQVGLCRPGDMGADVCHLNLHKTFCIPHGGGGPGMGPIGVAAHLVPFLPDSQERSQAAAPAKGSKRVGAVSAAPRGSASILTISWMYIRMMGGEGLTQATRIAILNANYIARRLDQYFPVLFKGQNGWVAHECIIDLRGFKHVTAEDVAKRLMDFGFHAPTLSWPVANTLMIEPTESESKAELDRFCEAMIKIHAEVTAVENGEIDRANNPLKNAPHTAISVIGAEWDRPYSREQAAFPVSWTREHKFWPAVGRIDNVWGDRNLFCSCMPVDDLAD